MSRSKIDICNLAILRMGGKQLKHISSLEENKEEARSCKILYPHTIEIMLRQHPFNFAQKQAVLALRRQEKDGSYSYIWPSEAIKIWKVTPIGDLYFSGEAIPHKVVNGGDGLKEIRCHFEQVQAFFSVMVADPNQMDDLFQDALAWAMAAEMAHSVADDPKRMQFLQQQAKESFAIAQSADANEQAFDVSLGAYVEARI